MPPSLKHSPLGTFSTSRVAVTFPELAFYVVSITGEESRDTRFLSIPLTLTWQPYSFAPLGRSSCRSSVVRGFY